MGQIHLERRPTNTILRDAVLVAQCDNSTWPGFRRSQGSTDRAFGEIPPEEIANAINQARREGRARDQDELYRTTRELLGDRRMTE
jgi:hypothetical protein